MGLGEALRSHLTRVELTLPNAGSGGFYAATEAGEAIRY